jgi:hypothetical protein
MYDELLAKAKAAVQPTDVVEMIWVRNAADLIWEAQRLRRLKTHLLSEARIRAVVASLALEAKLTARWLTGDTNACAAVEAKLAAQGLTWDAVTAQVLLSNLAEFERLERLIASADGRWERALTNIARRREGLAQELRRVAEAATANRPLGAPLIAPRPRYDLTKTTSCQQGQCPTQHRPPDSSGQKPLAPQCVPPRPRDPHGRIS